MKHGPEHTTVVRRQLGRRLRRFRNRAGLTSDAVANARIAQRTKLWRYEHGRVPVRAGDVMALGRLYALDHLTIDDLIRMANATGERNYVEDDRGKGVEERYWMHTDLEQLAGMQVEYSPILIPDLLQTPAYTHAVLTADPASTEEVIERRGEFQQRRREAFFGRDAPGRIEFLIPAPVLDLTVGSPEVVAEQLAHLTAVDGRGEVCVRVLPGFPGYRDGAFTLMDFDDPDDPPVVSVPCLIGSRYLELDEQVTRYRDAAGLLRRRSVPLAAYLGER